MIYTLVSATYQNIKLLKLNIYIMHRVYSQIVIIKMLSMYFNDYNYILKSNNNFFIFGSKIKIRNKPLSFSTPNKRSIDIIL